MFNWLLRACMTKSYDGSLTSNSKGSIKCVSLNNQLRPARPTLVNINYNEPLYYTFTINVNECDESWNTTDDPYARVCVPDKVKIWIQKYLT